MQHFEYVFGNPSPQALSYLDQLLSHQQGWFTNSASTAPIHPFFSRETFSDIEFLREDYASFADHPISQEVYSRLRPALRLASAMFDRCRDYWIVILEAPIHHDPGSQKEYFETDHMINQDPRLWWSNVDYALELMSQNTRICSYKVDEGTNYSDGYAPSGVTTAFYKPGLSDGQSTLRFRMALNSRLLDALCHPKFYDKPQFEQCIVHINIAITLVHELAHCLYLHRIRIGLLRQCMLIGQYPGAPEPFLKAFPTEELGYVFERLLLGNAIFAAGLSFRVNSRGKKIAREEFDGSRGLNLNSFVSRQTKMSNKTYRISEVTILMLLHEKIWRSNLPVPMYLLPHNGRGAH